MPARVIKSMSVAVAAAFVSLLPISAASAGCFTCGCAVAPRTYPACGAYGTYGYNGDSRYPSQPFVYSVQPSYGVEQGPTYRVVLISPYDLDRRFEYPLAHYYPYVGRSFHRHRHTAHW